MIKPIVCTKFCLFGKTYLCNIYIRLTNKQKWQKFSNLGQWPPQASTATSPEDSKRGTATPGCWWCRKIKLPPAVAAVGKPIVGGGRITEEDTVFCRGKGGKYCVIVVAAGCWWWTTDDAGGSTGQAAAAAAAVIWGRCCSWWWSWCCDWWCSCWGGGWLYLTPAVVTDDKASGSVVAPPPPLLCNRLDVCRWLLYTRWCLARRLAVYVRSLELFDDDPPAAGECLSALQAFLQEQ